MVGFAGRESRGEMERVERENSGEKWDGEKEKRRKGKRNFRDILGKRDKKSLREGKVIHHFQKWVEGGCNKGVFKFRHGDEIKKGRLQSTVIIMLNPKLTKFKSYCSPL